MPGHFSPSCCGSSTLGIPNELLEALSTGKPFRTALKGLFREPLAAHLRALFPLLLLALGLVFKTLVPLVLVALYLLYAALCVKPMHVPALPKEREGVRS